MIAFRQLILPGDSGSDVLAVKHALRAMGTQGAGAMNASQDAGPAFVNALSAAQRHGGLSVDGKYGKESHALIAPHFTAADEELYSAAAIRPREAATSGGDAAAPAKRLLELHTAGRYRAEGPADLSDVEATAEGRAVHSQSGMLVHIDARLMRVLVHLIEAGHTIGTSAICSDHHDDGPHGHAGGLAADISSIDGHSIAIASTRALVIAIDTALHHAGGLVPRQLISGGVGNKRDAEISRLSIPSPAFYGEETLQAHTNHIHVGY